MSASEKYLSVWMKKIIKKIFLKTSLNVFNLKEAKQKQKNRENFI